jgi:hypothetical protein
MGTGERRTAQGSSQSVHSSKEAGNDRGAKGRRKMERRRRHMSEQNLSTMTPAKEPKQDKEALRERWQWVEHTVWTDPMLRTLETGSKEEDRERPQEFMIPSDGATASLTRPGCST